MTINFKYCELFLLIIKKILIEEQQKERGLKRTLICKNKQKTTKSEGAVGLQNVRNEKKSFRKLQRLDSGQK